MLGTKLLYLISILLSSINTSKQRIITQWYYISILLSSINTHKRSIIQLDRSAFLFYLVQLIPTSPGSEYPF